MNYFDQFQLSNTKFQSLQTHQSRQGDWICIKCNNLNFSFRKKCNRCKLQTRQENDRNIMQVYHYYQQFYRPLDKRQYYQTNPTNTIGQNIVTQTADSALCAQFTQTEEINDNSLQIQLPSVSPIVKRYSKQKSTPKTQISEDLSSEDQGSNCSKQFYNDYCWKNILIDDDSDNEFGSHTDSYSQDMQWDIQIQKIVQNIVL